MVRSRSHLRDIVFNGLFDPAAKLFDQGMPDSKKIVAGLRPPSQRLAQIFTRGGMQILGQLVTAAADQYSLATIAYYLLSGCLPYTAKSQREMFTQLLSQPPIPLLVSRKGLDVSPAIEAVIMKGLARNPGDRYPDTLTFANALREAVETPPPHKGGLLGRVRSLLHRDDRA